MSKQFLGILIAIILVFVGIVVYSHDKSSNPVSSISPTEHIEGNKDASVALVEYGDYQCPSCEAYSGTLEQVVKNYQDKITFQFRNFPLTTVHQNAFAAAGAAEAAGLQGKYWEMHDALYSPANWQQWTAASTPGELFNSYAKQLGLNVDQFKKDYASSHVSDLINADIAAGNKLNINATPTFFLDGNKIEVQNDVQSFSKVLDAEIAKKNQKTQP